MTWVTEPQSGLEAAIASFKAALPGWWYTLGECEKSCDASIAPTRDSEDLALIPFDERFNDGFHCDLPQPSCLVDALGAVTRQAGIARRVAIRAKATSERETA